MNRIPSARLFQEGSGCECVFVGSFPTRDIENEKGPMEGSFFVKSKEGKVGSFPHFKKYDREVWTEADQIRLQYHIDLRLRRDTVPRRVREWFTLYEQEGWNEDGSSSASASDSDKESEEGEEAVDSSSTEEGQVDEMMKSFNESPQERAIRKLKNWRRKLPPPLPSTVRPSAAPPSATSKGAKVTSPSPAKQKTSREARKPAEDQTASANATLSIKKQRKRVREDLEEMEAMPEKSETQRRIKARLRVDLYAVMKALESDDSSDDDQSSATCAGAGAAAGGGGRTASPTTTPHATSGGAKAAAPTPAPATATASKTGAQTTTTSAGEIHVHVTMPAGPTAPERAEKALPVIWKDKDNAKQLAEWCTTTAQGKGDNKMVYTKQQCRGAMTDDVIHGLRTDFNSKKLSELLPPCAAALATFDEIWTKEPKELRDIVLAILGQDRTGEKQSIQQLSDPISQLNRYSWVVGPGGEWMKRFKADWTKVALACPALDGNTIFDGDKTRDLPTFADKVQYGDHLLERMKKNTDDVIVGTPQQEKRTQHRVFLNSLLEHIATEKTKRAKTSATHGKFTAEDVTLFTSARWDSLCAMETARVSSGMTCEEGQSDRGRSDRRDTGGGREYNYDRDWKRKSEDGGGRPKFERDAPREKKPKPDRNAKTERDDRPEDRPPRSTEQEGKEMSEAEIQKAVNRIYRQVEGGCQCCRGKYCFDRACVMWGRHPHYNKLAFKRGDEYESFETWRKKEGLLDEPLQLGDANGKAYKVTQQELEGYEKQLRDNKKRAERLAEEAEKGRYHPRSDGGRDADRGGGGRDADRGGGRREEPRDGGGRGRGGREFRGGGGGRWGDDRGRGKTLHYAASSSTDCQPCVTMTPLRNTPLTAMPCRVPKDKDTYAFCLPCSTTPTPLVKPIGLCALCEEDVDPTVRITNECTVRLHTFPSQAEAEGAPNTSAERWHAQEASSVDGRLEAGELVTALLDTGASSRNFISPALAARMIARGAVEVPTTGNICLASKSQCIAVRTKLRLVCKYLNVETKSLDEFIFEATILPQLRVDLIIGLRTCFIRELFYKMIVMPRRPPKEHGATRTSVAQLNRDQSCQVRGKEIEKGSHEGESTAVETELPVSSTDPQQEGALKDNPPQSLWLHHRPSGAARRHTYSLQTEKDPVASRNEQKCVSCEELYIIAAAEKLPCGAQSTHACRSSEFFGPADSGMSEEPDQFEKDSLIPDLPTEATSSSEGTPDLDVFASTHTEGREEFVLRLRALLEEFRDRFARTVTEDSAKVAPMELRVDADKLRNARLSGRARPMSEVKLATLRVMLNDLIRLGVVRHSKETKGSQVLLVAKKGTDKLRFCIDFRVINDATISPEGWPIPNIAELIREIGRKHARIFGVMDMTSGYHQTPLAESHKHWTSFITPDGMYEWNRVPMGLKGAGSYFSRTVQASVLGGLLHNIVESYLDDLIVWGTDEENFLDNLRTLLQRLRERNITLNPDKCRFGMSEVEFVGHTINGATGQTHFTRNKLDRVRDFPKPKSKGELKQFIGLANYFRAHVRDLSMTTHPLDQMLAGYESRIRHNVLKWTEETSAAFEKVRRDIDECPKLSFINPNWRIWLRTDASNYGIGAYLFQVNDEGEEIPIEFLSKSLSLTQFNWSVPEKEAYGIFYALKKWEHLLRDVNFILETDHENLTYLNFEGSAKVKRWKMLCQEFDFEIRFIKGELNTIADAFSRLCRNLEAEHRQRLAEQPASDRGGPTAEDLQDPTDDAATEMVMLMRGWEEEEAEVLFGPLDDDVALPKEIYKQITQAHNVFRGHSGVQRTVDRMKKDGCSFPHMREYVDKFIKQCPVCQKLDYRTFPVGVAPFTSATYKAMQRLQVDAIGPLPETEEGYKYILVVIDTFTRWTMLYPTRTTSGEEAAKAMIQHIGIFGAPSELVSDGGTQLRNATIRDMLSILTSIHGVGVIQHINVPYSSEENGIVERANKEVMRHLRALVFEQRRGNDWAIILPFAQRICNAEVCESNGYRPSDLIFGTAINLDRSVLTPNRVPECSHSTLSPYVKQLIAVQKHSLAAAAMIQRDLDAAHVAKRGAKTVTEFRAGSYVLVAYPDKGLGKRPPNKLMTQWRGPMLVVSSRGSEYVVEDLSTHRTTTVHASRLKPFRYDATRVDPKDIAAKDINEFYVESILDHRPKGQKRPLKGSLSFQVRWAGYDESHDSWEPWALMRDNIVVHAYCRAHDMSGIISKTYDPEPDDSDEGRQGGGKGGGGGGARNVRSRGAQARSGGSGGDEGDNWFTD